MVPFGLLHGPSFPATIRSHELVRLSRRPQRMLRLEKELQKAAARCCAILRSEVLGLPILPVEHQGERKKVVRYDFHKLTSGFTLEFPKWKQLSLFLPLPYPSSRPAPVNFVFQLGWHPS